MAISWQRHAVFSGVILTSLVLPIGDAQTTSAPKRAGGPAVQQKFFGQWKLNESKSNFTHAGDHKGLQWRSYEPDGDRVKVSWGDEERRDRSYSAKCDGTIEPAASGDIRCWQAGPNTIEGEQLSKSDALHRYYRRTVSTDGKSMTITWYSDATRKRPTDRFVYDKQ
ncbi:MAG TPA: hypothetical protein VE621_24445 [Bryobacteraceae bacterium]|nr:hypothetical protein [Bryobacteraceae bacterium]